eukprot:s3094_g3.t2
MVAVCTHRVSCLHRVELQLLRMKSPEAVTEGKWKPAPGKYDPQKPEKHVDCLQMTPENKEQGKSSKKGTPLGPGYYSPNFDVMEKRMPAYAVPKQDARGPSTGKDKDVDMANVDAASSSMFLLVATGAPVN